MKIAIVGTSHDLAETEEMNLRKYITSELSQYSVKDDTIISGGAKGVDKMAIRIAKGLGFKVKEFYPQGDSWQAYKTRNLEIIKACDRVVCFTVFVHDKKCYHHIYEMNHQKTAGCWTLKEAVKQNKTGKLIIVLFDGSFSVYEDMQLIFD